MNNKNNVEAMISHLSQEISWIEALNTLLAEEKIMLETRQFEHLEELANKKQDLSSRLEISAKERLDLYGQDKINTNPNAALQEFLKQCSPQEANEINKLNIKLVEQLGICRDLNTVNGQVIANNIHTRQQIVNVLSGNKSDATSVYTANGNLSSASDNTHHQEA